MKRIVMLLLLLAILFPIGCSAPSGSTDPLPSAQTAAATIAAAAATTIVDVFRENAELRSLFQRVADESILIANSGTSDQYIYDYYNDGTNSFLGSLGGSNVDLKEFGLSDAAGDAAASILSEFPGMILWIHDIDGGRMGVFFSAIYSSEIDEGEFDECDLIYTEYDLSDMVLKYGYEDLSEGWYACRAMLPAVYKP